MLGNLAKSIFGSSNDRQIKRLSPVLDQIKSFELQTGGLSDDEIRTRVSQLRDEIKNGLSLDDALPEVFALVKESSTRVLGMTHYDVQLIGGIVLHYGQIAEMKTGEGKTLTATLPVVLNALSGKGVHVVTVNDYLAKRDAEWMGKLYSFLGLSTGVIVHGLDSRERKDNYGADITYGQNNEFGFDYLRDNMKVSLEEKVQRGHNYAIVDEVDSILIDEARTPLIISGPAEDSAQQYIEADRVVRQLKEGSDYELDIKAKQVTLTEDGVKSVEKILGIENLYDPGHIQTVHHVNNGLSAHLIKQRDVDYVLNGQEVVIVDEFTGRQMPGRRWSDGLHQAVEAKEGVDVANESQTLATVTFQNYFRMYNKLAGMTGTADTESVEFGKIYSLNVVVIPTNRPLVRQDNVDIVYPTQLGKYKAVVKEIAKVHESGRPVLVGTGDIAQSELVSGLLSKLDVPHTVLNAKNHAHEAEIVAQAGRLGAVTISTNMAGRGTDILLGGNPEALAEKMHAEDESLELDILLEKCKEICAKEKEEVIKNGGLHIIGTQRHESRRIDNQLRGRAGRQGDPGSSRFYVSLEDELMKRFGGEKIKDTMSRLGLGDEDAIEGRLVGRSIENAQKKVEGRNFDIRKHLLEYDDVMNRQREVIYDLRETVLKSNGLDKEIYEIVGDVSEFIITNSIDEDVTIEEVEISKITEELKRTFGFELKVDNKELTECADHKELAQLIYDSCSDTSKEVFIDKQNRWGEDNMSSYQRHAYLQAIDQHWKDHLSNLDSLKEGIGLRGYSQDNPLRVYQREAFELFSSMMFSLKQSFIRSIFLVELVTEEDLKEIEEREAREQKAREKASRALHSDNNEDDSNEDSNLNRKQRRKKSSSSSKPKIVKKVPSKKNKRKKA